MNTIEQARESLKRIAFALERTEPDCSPIWACIADIAEVVNGRAPELLESLELLEKWGHNWTDEDHGYLVKARAAIAKARGEA